MRGTVNRALRYVEKRRFIPAHAGNSPSAVPTVINTSVHPRACGEQAGHRRAIMQTLGSSPRMRGTVNSISSRS